MVTRRVVVRRVRHGDTQSGGMQGALFRESGSRRGTERIQSALFRDAAGPGCAFPSRRGHRMRLSVKCAFPYLRKRGAVSRKSALCSGGLTEKRSVGGQPHGKAHSGRLGSRESAVCDSQIAQTALFRHIAAQEAWGATTRQAAGRFAPGSANLVWSLTSRKVAVWARSLDAQLG